MPPGGFFYWLRAQRLKASAYQFEARLLRAGLTEASYSRKRERLLVRFANERFHRLGVALDCEHDRPLFQAINAGGRGGNDLPAIWQAEPHRKGAVRPQLD